MSENLFTTTTAIAALCKTMPPLCRFCDMPAHCYGTYEGDTGYACNECCGHGCEDGHCDRLSPTDD